MARLMKKLDSTTTKVLTKKAPAKLVRPSLIKGKPDPRFPGFVLVRFDRAPHHDWFKPLNPRYTFPETYYRWDKRNNYVRCLVTIMADGTMVAWDICSYCHHYFTMCTCLAGVQTCRSVEYIHDSIQARHRGEEWSINHRDYRGSLTRADREARKLAAERPASPARVVQVPPADSVPATGHTRPGKTLRKVVDQDVPRRLIKRSDAEPVDLEVIDAEASKLVDDMTKEILSNGKPLKKLRRIRKA